MFEVYRFFVCSSSVLELLFELSVFYLVFGLEFFEFLTMLEFCWNGVLCV